jgi:hypothetical protein
MSLGSWVQLPPAHLSTVQAMPSSQAASAQQAAHVLLSAQQA